MNYILVLNEYDYLNYYLYTTSNSQKFNSRKIRGWLICILTTFAVLYIYYSNDGSDVILFFVGGMVVVTISYPFYLKWRYRSHFKSQIREKLSERLGVDTILTLDDGHIKVTSELNDVKIRVANIMGICEIKQNLFIKLKGGDALIIPKEDVLFDVNHFKDALKKEMNNEKIDVDWVVDEKWKW
ncbi:YcxB family protein [Marinigracilibium pacificum]|uniref:YcxB-like protein n=1 Tax=Marinigracilibium pacificum TaxID=2729599 RepID=A0A848IVR1_9BACT|nr:YcxB family protein [Marinigracilibium pacificum]NMM47268.1 hypothetical protein [Marinigracilibium pacificum]